MDGSDRARPRRPAWDTGGSPEGGDADQEFGDVDHFKVEALFPRTESEPMFDGQEGSEGIDPRRALRSNARRKPGSSWETDRTSTLKYLQQAERRGNRAMRKILETKARLDAEKAVGPVKSRKQTVEDTRQHAKENLKMYLQAKSVEEVKNVCQEVNQRVQQELQEKLQEVVRERDQYKYEVEQMQHKTQELESQHESLKYAVELLQKKLQKMGAREIENERKLRVFVKLEPVFSKLEEHFHFTDPAEVVQRLEHLEKLQVDSYQQLMEAQEQRAEVEHGLREKLAEEMTQTQALTNQMNISLEKAEKRHAQTQSQLEEVKAELSRAKEAHDRYLQLKFSVIDIWNRWQESELMGAEAEVEQPDMDEPVQVVSALNNLFTQHSPSRAGKALRELTGIANSIWIRFFTDKPEWKSRPYQIFSNVIILLQDRTKTIEHLQQVIASLRAERQKQDERFAGLERENRRYQTELRNNNPLKLRRNHSASSDMSQSGAGGGSQARRAPPGSAGGGKEAKAKEAWGAGGLRNSKPAHSLAASDPNISSLNQKPELA